MRWRSKEPSEDQISMAVFDFVKAQKHINPELDWLYHIPNEGKMSRIAGARANRAGRRTGMPDLHLPIPRAGWLGWFCELKARTEPTDAQLRQIGRLWGVGHFVCVAYSEPECTGFLMRYIQRDSTLYRYDLPPGLRTSIRRDECAIVRDHVLHTRLLFNIAPEDKRAKD